MRHEEHELEWLARQQRQVFSRGQVDAVGLNRKVISRRVSSGDWHQVGPNTFTFAGVELDWRGRLRAGILDLGDGAQVTAEAAAGLAGWDSYREEPLVFLVPDALRGRSTVGETITIPVIDRRDRRTIDGLPVTSPAMTLVQLAGRVTPELLGDAFDSACRQRSTCEADIERLLDRIGRQGRRGIADLAKVMEMAGVESWLERRFLELLPPGMPTPALQRIYRPDGKRVARVDFDFAPLPVIVEVGGRKGYMSVHDRNDKERRRNQLQLLGKTVYFFSREDIVDRPHDVVATLERAIQLAA